MARDLAIDLGTANTLVYMKSRGIVLNEPSVIALNRQTGEVLATGHEAWQMIGRTPGYIVAVRPLRGGAITDFVLTERMIRLLLQRVGVSRFTRPKVVICVPSAITEVERRAVTDAARRAGAADANLIEQPMAAAIGADLPIDEPVGNMVIDIGGGTTETAVISLGGIVALEAVRVGSFDIDAAIQNYVRREHGIAIGERTAEEIKVAIGSADPTEDENQAEVRGRDLMTGLPKTVLLTPEEIRFAIEDVISSLDRVGDPLPRQGATRAVAGLPRTRHVPRRRWRPAAWLGPAHRARDEGAGEAVQRATRGRRARSRPRDRALRGAEGHVHGRPPVAPQIGRSTMSLRIDATLEEGIRRIRSEFGVPSRVPAGGGDARRSSRRTTSRADRVDRTDRPFVTLDPATANDLDQAFAIERPVTTSSCTTPSPTSAPSSSRAISSTEEAWRRGVTIYLPGQQGTAVPGCACRRAPPACCPTVPGRPSCSRCASTPPAAPRLDGVERAVVRSRAKLAYDDRRAGRSPCRLRRARRGASRRPRTAAARPESSSPTRSWTSIDGGWELRFAPRLESEDHNAGMSLATNLAVADALLAAGTGLFRMMAEPDERAVARLRHTATAFGLRWPHRPVAGRVPALAARGDPQPPAFLLAVRRAGGGASYERSPPTATSTVARGDRRAVRPRHGAAAPARRPLRHRGGAGGGRGRPVPDDVDASFGALPGGDGRAEGLANRVDRAVLDLAEAVLLAGPRGRGVRRRRRRRGPPRHRDPARRPAAVLAHVTAHHVDPGDAGSASASSPPTSHGRRSSSSRVE